MALNFPNNPTLGDVHIDGNQQKWDFNGDSWVRQAPIELGDEAPDDGKEYVRKEENWVPLDNVQGGGEPILDVDYVRRNSNWIPLDVVGTGFKNAVINPNQQINHRVFKDNWGAFLNGEFGPDRWFKNGVNKVQYVEQRSLNSGLWTLSWEHPTQGQGLLGEIAAGSMEQAVGASPLTIDVTGHKAEGAHIRVEVPQGAWNVQLETGPIATGFEYRPIGLEDYLCRRYFIQLNLDVWSPYTVRQSGSGAVMTGNLGSFGLLMRTNPRIKWKDDIEPVWALRCLSDDTNTKVDDHVNVTVSSEGRAGSAILKVWGITASVSHTAIWAAYLTASTNAVLQIDAEILDYLGNKPT